MGQDDGRHGDADPWSFLLAAATSTQKSQLKVTLIDSKNTESPPQALVSPNWSSPFVPAGMYQLKVEGSVNGQTFLQVRNVAVKSGAEATADPVELK